jgi:hypothetical protein
VTTYVALRAVFGVARASIQQLARVASVEYLRIRSLGRTLRAESVLAAFLLAAVGFGTLFASGVVIDNLRILSLWLKHFDRSTFQIIDVSFALAAPFYAYQILLSLRFREGRLNHVAGRLYAFVFCSGSFAGVALAYRSLRLYLILLAIAEILLAASFMGLPWPSRDRAANAGQRTLGVALFGSVLVLALSIWTAHTRADLFLKMSWPSVAWAALILLIAAGTLTAFALILNRDLLRDLAGRRAHAQKPATATTAILSGPARDAEPVVP